jgi:hypothetical protein
VTKTGGMRDAPTYAEPKKMATPIVLPPAFIMQCFLAFTGLKSKEAAKSVPAAPHKLSR